METIKTPAFMVHLIVQTMSKLEVNGYFSVVPFI